jgi:hypothetical protein
MLKKNILFYQLKILNNLVSCVPYTNFKEYVLLQMESFVSNTNVFFCHTFQSVTSMHNLNWYIGIKQFNIETLTTI